MKTFRSLAGKRVFVTGAASGIGYETVLAFALQGCHIIATDIQSDGLAALLEQVQALGQECRTARLDVTDEAVYRQLFSELAAAGTLPDIVINNAGIGFMGSFNDTDDSAWQRVLDINVRGVANGCRSFLQVRGESSAPALLVNVASAAVIAPMPNMSAYAAAKYAVEGLSEVLALELAGSPVGVVCVYPGVINTAIVDHPELAIIPAGQLAKLQDYYRKNGAAPESVAQAIVDAVRKGSPVVYTGAGVRSSALLKRLLPRSWFRRLLLGNARKIGYLQEFWQCP